MWGTQENVLREALVKYRTQIYTYIRQTFSITKEGLFRDGSRVQMLQQLTTTVIPGELQRFAWTQRYTPGSKQQASEPCGTRTKMIPKTLRVIFQNNRDKCLTQLKCYPAKCSDERTIPPESTTLIKWWFRSLARTGIRTADIINHTHFLLLWHLIKLSDARELLTI